ncbi:hypothetical protein EHQ43_11655 [Leptospira bouyouniensis]|uniref:Uncharacterized protein n=1 Tax=Leptospira bouyouniensis TaxID=2484911 RepID=A0A7I0HPT6_9LEPT|nr:hypothetical protein [Leptospira bouyouniensis]TGL04054.1 hypothetical protein EHQ43_11655 [Leptospira bouyouniensis]
MHKFIHGKWVKVDEEQKEIFITKQELKKSRFWTEKMISMFFPSPDKEVKNNNYKTEHSIKLYNKENVIKIENSEDFLKYREENKKRRDGSKKALNTKVKKIMKDVENIEISIPLIEKSILLEQAVNHFNIRQIENGNFNWATLESDDEFLKRIMRNFIRHELSDYRIHLLNIYGRVGRKKAFKILKLHFNKAIINLYPWLECKF